MTSSDRPLAAFSRYAAGRSHDLGRMDFKALVPAFFLYPTVLLYLVLAAAAGGLALQAGIAREPVRAGAAVIATFIVYALVWYGLHRFVLHARLLYRSPLTARLWKRIHFDHHQDPHRMAVLFGSPVTTLPTIAAVTLPLGYAIGGWAGAWDALFAGLAITVIYEFCHCCMHLNYTPRQRWLQRAKTMHMAHHFHDETGNYGIISFWPDLLFGTLYRQPAERQRSATVFNLGYDSAAEQAYPWVAALSRSSNAPQQTARRPARR